MTLAAETVLDGISLLNEGLQYDDPAQQERTLTLARQTLLADIQPTDPAYEEVAALAEEAEEAIDNAADVEERREAIVAFRSGLENVENEVKE